EQWDFFLLQMLHFILQFLEGVLGAWKNNCPACFSWQAHCRDFRFAGLLQPHLASSATSG
ncbi:MAG TPA: hypothetical protein PLB12_08620, partial [Candidatus Goldiibacteriota bacterium]|nr:hypothetical protein [Candidatus Goldiibacteriota bacterium]